MGSTFKMLASRTVAPDGQNTELYTPPRGGCAVIGRITIVSAWPTIEQQGYQAIDYHPGVCVEFTKDGKDRYSFGRAETGATDSRGQYGVLAPNSDTTTNAYRPQRIVDDSSNQQYWGVYSMFRLIVEGTPVSGRETAPRLGTMATIDHAIPLGSGQRLGVMNGITLAESRYLWPDRSYVYSYTFNTEKVRTEHRRRASSLIISLFGQEFSE